MQLQPTFRQQLSQDKGDVRIGADELLAVLSFVTQIRKHLAGTTIGLHRRPGENMRIALASCPRSCKVHAGNILLTDIAAYRMQILKLQLIGPESPHDAPSTRHHRQKRFCLCYTESQPSAEPLARRS